jgi:hypothetical protein
VSTADVVARETAWLQTSGDGLPALLTSAGGPFADVHAYWPRGSDMNTYSHTLYVMRTRIAVDRFANVRLMPHYPMHLVAWWAVVDGSGSAETEQSNLDSAIDLVLTRINGLLGDKTHGGRFLSVAENPRVLDVEFAPAEATLPEGYLRADVLYSADDPELNM